jgi:hypothetical protein
MKPSIIKNGSLDNHALAQKSVLNNQSFLEFVTLIVHCRQDEGRNSDFFVDHLPFLGGSATRSQGHEKYYSVCKTGYG